MRALWGCMKMPPWLKILSTGAEVEKYSRPTLRDQDQDQDCKYQDQNQDLRSQDQDQDQNREKSVSSALETKTAVSRTTSLAETHLERSWDSWRCRQVTVDRVEC